MNVYDINNLFLTFPKDDDVNAPSGSQAGSPAPAEHPLVIQRSVERDDYASPSLDASTAAVDLDNFRYQHDFTPVIDFSVDLEQLPVSEISNPWSFFHEISALEGYGLRALIQICADIYAAYERDMKPERVLKSKQRMRQMLLNSMRKWRSDEPSVRPCCRQRRLAQQNWKFKRTRYMPNAVSLVRARF